MLGLYFQQVPIASSISMEPTLTGTSLGMLRYPNGYMLNNTRLLGYDITHGDIVSIENDTIKNINMQTTGIESGWIKRVIAIAGDTIELREGLVYINNKPQLEGYTAKPRSTFGDTFIPDCTKVTVPEGYVFVMGDNRKASIDSRKIGFIPLSDIHHILPKNFQSLALRSTINDLDKSSQTVFDSSEYLSLLSEKRKTENKNQLAHTKRLDDSTKKRAEVMLATNDFSTDATISGYSVSTALRDQGFTNTRWGETYTLGYYSAEELVAYQSQFPDSLAFLLEPTFAQTGISAYEGTINSCPTQIIVQHFVGIVSQKSIQELVTDWRGIIAELKKEQTKWKDEEIRKIIATRITNLTAVVNKLSSYQNLTAEEQLLIDKDKELETLQKELIQKLSY